MDGIEECGRSGNLEVVAAAVECVVGLLDALEKLCSGSIEYLTPEQATLILEHWPKLHDADYSGPLTYQTLARLPSPYRYVNRTISYFYYINVALTVLNCFNFQRCCCRFTK